MKDCPEPGVARSCERGHRVVVALLGALCFAGCMSQGRLYQEVRTARSRAYVDWQRTRENGQDTQAHLEGELALEDAIKLSMIYNKSLQAALQQRENARGRVVASYAEVLPKVSAAAGYTRLDEVASFDVGGQSMSLGLLNNYSVDLVVRQPIFRGGAMTAAMRGARVFAYLADERVRGQVQLTIFEVANAYYATLLAQHLCAVNEEAVKSAEAHLEDVKRKRTQGVASEYDVLRAQVDVSNFRAEMIQQRNGIHLAQTRLLKEIGVSQDSQVTLSDPLTYSPMEPVLEEAVRLAYDNRADLYQAELGIRLQVEALRIARSKYWPTVDAIFTQGWSRPNPHSSTDSRWGDAWTAGITVDWPLFDGLRREGCVIQEKALLQQRNIELLDTQERVLLDVQQALLSLRDAEEFVESQRLNLERAEEGLRLAEVGYREGINTEVEITDARAALTRARALHFQAIYGHTIARLFLQRAIGILGPRAGVNTVPTEARVKPGYIEEFADPLPKENDEDAMR